jgi:hypothetical protein
MTAVITKINEVGFDVNEELIACNINLNIPSEIKVVVFAQVPA